MQITTLNQVKQSHKPKQRIVKKQKKIYQIFVDPGKESVKDGYTSEDSQPAPTIKSNKPKNQNGVSSDSEENSDLASKNSEEGLFNDNNKYSDGEEQIMKEMVL